MMKVYRVIIPLIFIISLTLTRSYAISINDVNTLTANINIPGYINNFKFNLQTCPKNAKVGNTLLTVLIILGGYEYGTNKHYATDYRILQDGIPYIKSYCNVLTKIIVSMIARNVANVDSNLLRQYQPLIWNTYYNFFNYIRYLQTKHFTQDEIKKNIDTIIDIIFFSKIVMFYKEGFIKQQCLPKVNLGDISKYVPKSYTKYYANPNF